jgi:hypothetical protein
MMNDFGKQAREASERMRKLREMAERGAKINDQARRSMSEIVRRENDAWQKRLADRRRREE